MARRHRPDSQVYRDVASELDNGFQGTYGELADRVNSHPRGVGAVVKKYGRLRPEWDPRSIVSARTGEPAFVASARGRWRASGSAENTELNG